MTTTTVVIPVEIPTSMPLPPYVPTLGITRLSVSPQPDGSLDLTVTVRLGTLVLSRAPLTFSVPALLKLLTDLAADAPVLIADVLAVFAATPGPTPPPRLVP